MTASSGRGNFWGGPFSKIWILLWVVAALPHLAVAILFLDQPIALDDMFHYDMLARSLSAGQGYRWYARPDFELLKPYLAQFMNVDELAIPENGLETTFRAPGYPFFLAGLYLLAPLASRFAVVRVAQALLMAALAPLAALLGNLAGFSRRVSILAGLWVGLYPILLFYPVGLASEDLYIPLAMLALVLVAVAASQKGIGWLALAGLAGGFTILTRSVFLPFILLASAWLAKCNPRGKKAGLWFALIALGLCMPWSFRNSILNQRLSFVENSLGYNLFIGYHPAGNGGFVAKAAAIPLSILDDAERDRWSSQAALEFIRRDPIGSLARVFNRLVALIGPETREFAYLYGNNYLGEIAQPWLFLLILLLVIPWLFTLFFGTVGLWYAQNRRIVYLALALLAGYVLPILLILSEPRFHLPLVPMLMPFAVFGWSQKSRLWDALLHPKTGLDRTLAAILLCLAVLWIISMISVWPGLAQLFGPEGNKLYLPY